MKRKIATLSLLFALMIVSATTAYAASTNTYSTSKEKWQLWYTGYVQVQPAYKIPSNPGYGLSNYVGKNIKQGGFWYNVDGKIKGKTYTKAATSKYDYNTYSAEKTVTDTLDPFAPSTSFYRSWTAF